MDTENAIGLFRHNVKRLGGIAKNLRRECWDAALERGICPLNHYARVRSLRSSFGETLQQARGGRHSNAQESRPRLPLPQA